MIVMLRKYFAQYSEPPAINEGLLLLCFILTVLSVVYKVFEEIDCSHIKNKKNFKKCTQRLLKAWHLIHHINHSGNLLFLQECNYILSNKTWKGSTSFKMHCVLPRQQEGIPSSWEMLTSLCGRTMDSETRWEYWNFKINSTDYGVMFIIIIIIIFCSSTQKIYIEALSSLLFRIDQFHNLFLCPAGDVYD